MDGINDVIVESNLKEKEDLDKEEKIQNQMKLIT